jgi:single-strand DNA-binding protein
MEGINKVIIVGNLGRKPDLIDAKGTSILRMSVGVNERYKGKNGWINKNTWIPVSLFGKRAEKLSKMLSKGTLVAVEGRLNPRTFTTKGGEKKFTIDVMANQKFSFWTTGAKEATEVPSESEEPPLPDMQPPPDLDDMPF